MGPQRPKRPISVFSSHIARCLLASLLLLTMASVVIPGAAAADAKPKAPASPEKRSTPTQPVTECFDETPKRHRICVRGWSGEAAARRAQQVRRRHPEMFRDATRESAAAVEPAACGFGSPWTFDPDPERFLSCGELWWELFAYETNDDGTVEITGSLNLNNRQWNGYGRTSTAWTHGLTIRVLEGRGTLATGSPVVITSLCGTAAGPNCRVADTARPASLTPGSVHSFEWTEEAVGLAPESAEGNVVGQENLGVRLASDDASGTPWEFDDNELWGRCDNALGGQPPGCVNPYATPTMLVERVRYGAAAEMIAWAQQNLEGAWGVEDGGRPLHRLTGPLSEDNREIMCGRLSGFVRDPVLDAALSTYNDQDTCDEFPFASTYESGPMEEDVNGDDKPYVTTGAQCAQVTAYQTASTGDLPTDFARVRVSGDPTGRELCIRGHIPGRLNSGVGGKYIATINEFRILDRDAFWLTVQ
ncbi:hypothetical protein ACN3XK_68010 [Actinomadura welshii]